MDIPAAHSKTGVAHLLPISPAAAKEFERLKRIAGSSHCILPTEDGDAPIDCPAKFCGSQRQVPGQHLTSVVLKWLR